MAVLVSDIVERVQAVLQDTTGVRWPVTSELLLWINDAQRELALLKPDATASTSQVTLDTGTKQGIPNDGNRLLKVVRNVDGSGNGKRSVRLVDGDILDSQTPDWHDSAVTGDAQHSTVVKHYIYSEDDPKVYYVYPGVQSGQTVKVEIIYSKNPDDVTGTGESDYISVADIYSNAIMNYVLYMAYMKDSEYAGNQQRASTHYQLFTASVTAKNQLDLITSPNAEAMSSGTV